jgi:hypothetical protein
VEKMKNYTRNECKRYFICSFGLKLVFPIFKNRNKLCGLTATIHIDELKLHSKRVEKMQNYARSEWRRFENHTRNEFSSPSLGPIPFHFDKQSPLPRIFPLSGCVCLFLEKSRQKAKKMNTEEIYRKKIRVK